MKKAALHLLKFLTCLCNTSLRAPWCTIYLGLTFSNIVEISFVTTSHMQLPIQNNTILRVKVLKLEPLVRG